MSELTWLEHAKDFGTIIAICCLLAYSIWCATKERKVRERDSAPEPHTVPFPNAPDRTVVELKIEPPPPHAVKFARVEERVNFYAMLFWWLVVVSFVCMGLLYCGLFEIDGTVGYLSGRIGR